ncbi:MAG: HEPN domain-containing protein [Candidatus Nezhaarchaeales archaeon]
MLDEKEYEKWFNTGRRNVSSAREDLGRGDYSWACFKAQQAAEVAVKALLHGLGLPAYGHSISRLLKGLEAKGVKIDDDLMYSAKSLDKLYVPTRYPNAWAEGTPYDYYTKKDAENAINDAEKILQWVEDMWRYLKRGKG